MLSKFSGDSERDGKNLAATFAQKLKLLFTISLGDVGLGNKRPRQEQTETEIAEIILDTDFLKTPFSAKLVKEGIPDQVLVAASLPASRKVSTVREPLGVR